MHGGPLRALPLGAQQAGTGAQHGQWEGEVGRRHPPEAYWSRLTACSTMSMVTSPAEGMAGAPTAASEAVRATTSSSAMLRCTPWA